MQAFSSGISVISTKAGGIPYIVTDSKNGMPVPLNDERSKAKKAIYLLENQELARKIAEKGQEDCIQKYSWNTNKAKWFSLYGME